MIIRPVELYLISIFRDLCEPIYVGSVVGSTIHVDPTFCADPFSALFDIGMAAGNCHGDVARVLQSDTVFCTRIPESVGCGKFAMAFDLRGSGIVKIETPMGNIAMMANP